MKLEGLVKMARLFKTPLFLPEPVEIELERKWLRDFTEAQAELQGRAKDFSRHMAIVGMEELSLSLPGEGEVLVSYKRRTTEIKEKWPLISTPFTKQEVRRFFDMATIQELPFEKDDKGFRDTVILYSIIDHLRNEDGVIGALAANDRVFGKPEVAHLIKQAGVELEVYDSTDKILDEFRKRYDDAVTTAWNALERSALKAVNGKLPELQKFISDNLEMPEELFESSFGGITVDKVEIVEVRSVRTPDPFEHPQSGATTITMNVALKVYYLKQGFSPRPPRSLKVGDSSINIQTDTTIGEILPMVIEKTLDCVAEVEAEASVENSEYKSVEFMHVKLQRSPYSKLAQILRRGSSEKA